MLHICINCNDSFEDQKRSVRKFCCRDCATKYKAKIYIADWLDGKVSGHIKPNYRISGYIRNFLIDEADHKCSLCGWGVMNPISEKIPLHIDHIDGNASNCVRINLRVLCPNCHSLTPNFGALNIGNSVRKYGSWG